jgi:hypothetical protein
MDKFTSNKVSLLDILLDCHMDILAECQTTTHLLLLQAVGRLSDPRHPQLLARLNAVMQLLRVDTEYYALLVLQFTGFDALSHCYRILGLHPHAASKHCEETHLAAVVITSIHLHIKCGIGNKVTDYMLGRVDYNHMPQL